MYVKFITLCLSIAFICNVQAQKLTQLWESEKVLDTPESVFISDDVLYVSSIGGTEGLAKDANGFISKMSKDGKVIELKWVDGLNGPKGLFVTEKTVVVADIDRIVVLDKQTGKIQEEFPIEGAKFLNDVVVTDEGVIVTTDYKATTIYQIKDKEVSVLVKDDQLDHVNGLHIDGDMLLAGTNSKVFKIDMKTEEMELWSDAPIWIDGLEPIDDHRILVSDWGGKIVLLNNEAEHQILVELDSKEYNTADMDYDPVTKRLFIPTFFRNTVICYQYEE